MPDSKGILLCGNGMSGQVISQIKDWGYRVGLISEFPEAIGARDADFFIEAASKDPGQALKAATELMSRGFNFDGVISLCWDCAPSVALIAEHFNLRAVSRETAENCTRKDLRSKVLELRSIPAPRYCLVKSAAEVLEFVKNNELPIILKPTNRSSSKGVILVEQLDQIDAAIRYCQSYSEDGVLVANEYLSGSEHSTEGLMINGKLYLSAISDRVFRYEEYKPYFVEVGDIMPTTLSDTQIDTLTQVTEAAALALGITDGIVKGDLLLSERRGCTVLEIAARLGGPRFGTEMVPLSNGTNILRAAIQQALGEEIDLNLLKPKFAKGMVNRSIFPLPGEVIEISGLDTARELPGFYDFSWWMHPLKPGDKIDPYENSCGGIGYFIVYGDTREDALIRADAIEKKISIKTRRVKEV